MSRKNINQDFDTAIGKGDIPGHSRILIRGYITGLTDALVPADLWSRGGLFDFPKVAKTLYVTSSSASSLAHVPLCKVRLPEKTDIWISVDDLSKTSSTAFNSYMQATLVHKQTDKLNGITP
jgi:hypothetical protein